MERLAVLLQQIEPGESEVCDVLIIGGGVVGIASAYWLTKSQPELRVVLLEKHTVAHVASSSFGDSRMYRCMYDRPYYARMQEAALKLWQQLEEESGQKIISAHGLLFYGDTDTGETVEGSLPSVQAVVKELGIPHQTIATHSELNTRWPVLATPGQEGIWEPGAGSLHARKACEAMKQAAVRRGLILREGEAAVMLSSPAPGMVRVVTSKGGVLEAKKAVLAAGAWTNDLLKLLGIELALEVHKMHWAHYSVDPGLAQRYPQWYHFGRGEEGTLDGGLYYGFPPEDSVPIVKVGIDFVPEGPAFCAKSPRDLVWRPDPAMLATLHTFLTSRWRGFKAPVDYSCSPYTMTPDGMFILDVLPARPEVAIFAGGCGRAFKFGILLGRCLAEITLGQKPSFDVQPLKLGSRLVMLRNEQTP